jgi:hypothetical protein
VVLPGETIDVGVELEAPRQPGSYRGFWYLRDDRGQSFGIGSAADSYFWVDIQVILTDRDFTYDFATNFCLANWQSLTRNLPCPGNEGSNDGFVILLQNPDLENRSENEVTLWVHPSEDRNGYIEGRYPATPVGEGDRFLAWVGCLEGYEDCDLTFYLDAVTLDGRTEVLGEWHEVYEGQVTKIDIDLSEVEGESVRFILGVTVNNTAFEDAHGFWFVPRIEENTE